jgi:predicted Rossmann fold nucleotide-binding protein DprA/Smf involved in DNA uptake
MMSDVLTVDTKAVLLLCGAFGKRSADRPLSPTEYTSLVRWLISAKLRPGDLLDGNMAAEASSGTGIDGQRLESLLGRGVQLGFAVEEWQRHGIWILSRSDADYPARYKKELKDRAPPLLFGVGDRSLLSRGGLAIVGSRNVDKVGEEFTRDVGGLCAANGLPVVSGGARGVDQIAMTAALEAGGVSLGVLAENLLKKSVERSARHAIADRRLLLLSPYHPNARFTVGTAMSRNKLIYALADFALVVSADYRKGGTWAGAEEELKRTSPRPVFVRVGADVPQGNRKLLEWGAIAWPEIIDVNNFRQELWESAARAEEEHLKKNQMLFAFQAIQEEQQVQLIKEEGSDELDIKLAESDGESTLKKGAGSLYEAVLPVILGKLEAPVDAKQLAEALEVSKTQLNTWLKRAVDEKKVIKLTKPVRYKRVAGEDA